MKVITTRKKQTEKSESATDRQERISGWRQDRFVKGRALIVGAGALGNEVAKNLALMGIGYMFLADFDHVERSNLSRAVLFRESDVHHRRSKAEIVAERSKALNVTPDAHVQPFHGNIVWELGGGVYRRVDVVLGCLDNVEARMSVNANCLFTGTPYIDGGILGLAGNVTAVNPPLTPCWECTTNARERQGVIQRYSCAGIMARQLELGHLPSVQVASSIIAGFQTQEAVKVILGLDWSAGFMIQYNASGKYTDLDVVRISRRPNCWCNIASTINEIIELSLSATVSTLSDLIQALHQHGISDPQIELPSPFVVERNCHNCNHRTAIMRPGFTLDTGILVCPVCNAGNDQVELESLDSLQTTEFEKQSDGEAIREQLMSMSLNQLGFPRLALISFTDGPTNSATRQVAELSGDAVSVMGGETYATPCR